MSNLPTLEQTQNQFLIRFPQEMAAKLNLFFDGKTDKAPDLRITPIQTLQGNERQISFKIHMDGINRKANLIQLPTITQTFKTIDRVNFFKSNDISEMILVHQGDKAQVPEKVAKRVRQNNGLVRYKSHSGITPPTKYIKQRFFRKKPLVNIDDIKKIESQLYSLRQQLPFLARGPDIQLSQSKKNRRKFQNKSNDTV